MLIGDWVVIGVAALLLGAVTIIAIGLLCPPASTNAEDIREMNIDMWLRAGFSLEDAQALEDCPVNSDEWDRILMGKKR